MSAPLGLLEASSGNHRILSTTAISTNAMETPSAPSAMADRTGLITPWGGRLVDRLLPEAEAKALAAEANRLPAIQLTPRALCDLELLATGAFSPLDRFMGRADYVRVVGEMRLMSGALFPIPITLTADDKSVPRRAESLALRDPHNNLVAVMRLEEVFSWDADGEAREVLGTVDSRHPLVAEMRTWGRVCVSGPIQVLALPCYHDFPALRLTPAQVRERLATLGRRNVVAFQTRNPLHRVHEELTKRAAAEVDGTLLIHPAVGLTRDGDVDHYTRVRVYQTVVQAHYEAHRTLLSLIPLAMRMAGPREALWHAILRRNYGANHLIVGRDHAGPGLDSRGQPFYPPDAARVLVEQHQDETDVQAVGFPELVYVPDRDAYLEAGQVSPGMRTLSLSGTQVRTEYLAAGKTLPPWFTRPETAAILHAMHPPRLRQGFCVWFTGLSGSGKSTTARILTALLLARGRQVTVLDGDVVRTHLSRGLGFSREDRDTNILRIGFVASEIVRHHGAVICAAVSPYRAVRDQNRRSVGTDRFIEVFMDTPLGVCEARDIKGLYAKARRGELAGFTGIDDPYEEPLRPELRLETVESTAEDNARRILEHLVREGLVALDFSHRCTWTHESVTPAHVEPVAVG